MKRITGLLEKGCTMLAAHHDCGAPLFRCKGEIICPICSSSSTKPSGEPVEVTKAVVSHGVHETKKSSEEPTQTYDQGNQEANRRNQRNTNQESERLVQNLGEPSRDSEFEITKQSVRIAVLFRLKDLALDIKEEKDLCRLRSQLDCVAAALRVISSLK